MVAVGSDILAPAGVEVIAIIRSHKFSNKWCGSIVIMVTWGNTQGMKGDWVEIVIDAGGTIRTYEVTATKAGRRVEVTTRRGVVEVSEVTRSGGPVRTARFMASRILALVEHPANGERHGAVAEPLRGPMAS